MLSVGAALNDDRPKYYLVQIDQFHGNRIRIHSCYQSGDTLWDACPLIGGIEISQPTVEGIAVTAGRDSTGH